MKNKDAYLFNAASRHILEEALEPLKQYGIQTIGYRRFFPDGRYLALSNALNYQRDYFCKLKNPGKFFSKIIEETPEDRVKIALWKGTPSKDTVLSMLHHHDIWNGVSLYAKEKDYVKCIAFAGTSEDTELTDFYINNIPLLKNFIFYFKSKTQEIINCGDKNIFGTFETSPKLDLSPAPELPTPRSFDTLLPHYIIELNGKNIKITKQELVSLKALLRFKHTKIAADHMKIAPRTIEGYLNNLKRRLGVYNNTQLFTLFDQGRYKWF